MTVITAAILGSLITGVILGAALVRYGIALGARIVNKTTEGLPAFGGEPVAFTQSHTGEEGIEDDE